MFELLTVIGILTFVISTSSGLAYTAIAAALLAGTVCWLYSKTSPVNHSKTRTPRVVASNVHRR